MGDTEVAAGAEEAPLTDTPEFDQRGMTETKTEQCQKCQTYDGVWRVE